MDMMTSRLIARHRTFGRRAVPLSSGIAAPAPSIGDDARLFAMTFLGGFLFMTVYLA